MGTLFGAVFGYMLRGTTESEGFREMMESALAVKGSPEFENLLRSARSHAGFMIRDLTERLSQQADHIADALTADTPAPAKAQPAAWEVWPPARKHGRPFSDDPSWPES